MECKVFKPQLVCDDINIEPIKPVIAIQGDKFNELLEKLTKYTDFEEFKTVAKRVLVAFDTDPKRYRKIDYFTLLNLLLRYSKNIFQLESECEELCRELEIRILECKTIIAEETSRAKQAEKELSDRVLELEESVRYELITQEEIDDLFEE